MIGQFNAVARRLVHNGMCQRSTLELGWRKGAFPGDTSTRDTLDSLKGLIQGIPGSHLESQVMESDILAAIKGRSIFFRLPQGQKGRAIMEEERGVGFHPAHLFVAEDLKELEGGVKVRDGKTDVGDSCSVTHDFWLFGYVVVGGLRCWLVLFGFVRRDRISPFAKAS